MYNCHILLVLYSATPAWWHVISYEIHVLRCYDLVDLWVIKIQKPMILCTRCTSRSRELSTKRSENT